MDSIALVKHRTHGMEFLIPSNRFEERLYYDHVNE